MWRVPEARRAWAVNYVSSAIRDLTRRKRVERELRDNQAQMLAAQRIQACLLPNAPPKLSGFDIAGASYPADHGLQSNS